jgi:hypothetical protein
MPRQVQATPHKFLIYLHYSIQIEYGKDTLFPSIILHTGFKTQTNPQNEAFVPVYQSLVLVYQRLVLVYQRLVLVYERLVLVYERLVLVYERLVLVYQSLVLVYQSLVLVYQTSVPRIEENSFLVHCRFQFNCKRDSFSGSTGYDDNRNRCIVNTHVGNNVHAMLKQVKGVYSGLRLDSGGAVITGVDDTATGSTTGEVTPARAARRHVRATI